MLREKAKFYYLDKGLNCAEALLLACRDYYDLEITDEEASLVTAFGGGMGCGRTCGALTGAIAALGKIVKGGKGEVYKASAGLIQLYEKEMETSLCNELMPKYKNTETRCLKTVELSADIVEEFISENVIKN